MSVSLSVEYNDIPTLILYHKGIKKARKILQNKEIFLINLCQKWQTREEKTGLENLKIYGKYFGFEINDRSDGYCTQLGLTEHLGKRVSTYSKGMKRKLSLLIVMS